MDEARERRVDAVQEAVDVVVQLAPAHGPRDATRRDGSPHGARHGAVARQKPLGIHGAVGPFVVGLGQVVAQRPVEPEELLAGVHGAPQGVGYQQVALDVTAPPGVDLQAGLGGAGVGTARVVAVQHAQAAGCGRRRADTAQMLRGAVGLASAQDHRLPHRPGHGLGEALGPHPEDVPVAGTLHVEEEGHAVLLRTSVACGLGKRRHSGTPEAAA